MSHLVVFEGNTCLGVFENVEQVRQHIRVLVGYCHRHGGRANLGELYIHDYHYHFLRKVYTIDNSYNIVEKTTPKEASEPAMAESDINLFIPLETVPNVRPQVPNLEEIEKKLNYLTKLKQEEEKGLSIIKEEYEKKEEEYREEKAKMDKLKQKMKQDQEKWEEIEKKFYADKKLYFIFKNEISTGQRDEDDVPILFKDTYPLFKQLDEESKLDVEDEIKTYLELTKYYKSNIFITSEFDSLFQYD